MKRLKGFTLIELLIVVAIIAILAAIAVPNFLEAQTRAKVSRVRSDQRTYATALEAYYIDNNAYPAFSGWDNDVGGPSANGGPFERAPIANLAELPTFRTKVDQEVLSGTQFDNVATLTTPVSYVTSYFTDAFALIPGATFAYSPCLANANPGAGWILISAGPNKAFNVIFDATTPAEVQVEGDEVLVVEETVYSCTNNSVSVVLSNRTYDPTNGTNSAGDVYRLKQ